MEIGAVSVGFRVTWKRVISNKHSNELDGWGTLEQLEKDMPIRIVGDYGLYSTNVQKIIKDGDSIYAITENSLYEIKEAKNGNNN